MSRSSLELPLYHERESMINGEQAEKLCFGSSGASIDYTTYKNQARQAILSGITAYENRNGNPVLKKEFALADALNIEIGPTEKHKDPSLSQIGSAIQSGLRNINQEFFLIPTGGRPLDYDYGTDAMICMLSDTIDRKSIARGESPYISLGVTTRDKEAERQRGQGSIPSDIEILFPNTKQELQQLVDTRGMVPYLKEIVFQGQEFYNHKAQGEFNRQSHFIDYRNFI